MEDIVVTSWNELSERLYEGSWSQARVAARPKVQEAMDAEGLNKKAA